jgi:hypothetical protein
MSSSKSKRNIIDSGVMFSPPPVDDGRKIAMIDPSGEIAEVPYFKRGDYMSKGWKILNGKKTAPGTGSPDDPPAPGRKEPAPETGSPDDPPAPGRKEPGKKDDLINPEHQEQNSFIKVENYIESIWDLHYNEVANKVEGRKRGTNDFKQVNEFDIYRELKHNNIKISLSDLKALLGSDFVKRINPFKVYFESLYPWDHIDHINNLANHVKALDQEEFNHHLK